MNINSILFNHHIEFKLISLLKVDIKQISFMSYVRYNDVTIKLPALFFTLFICCPCILLLIILADSYQIGTGISMTVFF